LLVLASAACAPDAGDDSARATATTETTATETPATSAPETLDDDVVATETSVEAYAVPAALDWSADLIGGGRIDLAERGDPPVLLWFWAPY